MRRSQRSSQITAALQRRVDLHKKLDAWCEKQAKRDDELGQLLDELVKLGEKPTELADILGISRKHVRQLIDEATPHDHEANDDNHHQTSPKQHTSKQHEGNHDE